MKFGANVISVTMGRLVDQVPFDFHWGGEHLDRLPLDKPIGGQVNWRSTLQLFVINIKCYCLLLVSIACVGWVIIYYWGEQVDRFLLEIIVN